MKIFISWSGERSKVIASHLRDWLKSILKVETWMSDSDLNAGEQWPEALTKGLKKCSFAVLCLDSENINAPWIIYEAGAIANSMGKVHVVPYLIDIGVKALPDPLKQFKAVYADREGTEQLLISINRTLHKPLEDRDVKTKFRQEWWYALEPHLSRPVEGIRYINNINDIWKIADQMVREVPEDGFIFDTTCVKNQKSYEDIIQKRAEDGVHVKRIIATNKGAKIEEFIKPPWSYSKTKKLSNVTVRHYPHPLPFDILITKYDETNQVIVGFKNSADYKEEPQYQSALHATSPDIARAFLDTYQNFLKKESHEVLKQKTKCQFCKSVSSKIHKQPAKAHHHKNTT